MTTPAPPPMPEERMTPEKAMMIALQRHPDCSHAEWDNGLDYAFRLTYVVKLWRNEECWRAGDPPRHIEEGFLR